MDKAIVLAGGLLHTPDAKTTHGLIREGERFLITAVIDEVNAGNDAGEVLDGKFRGIPVVKNIRDALYTRPAYCIVGVATNGGVFPPAMLDEIRQAISSGLSVVNGLHDYLCDRQDMAALAKSRGVELIDVRKPRPVKDLHFWTGAIRNLKTPVVAVMGTDCSLGKRTTTRFLLKECKQEGIEAQMIYTGQTGWLQGGKYGFIFDSTLNDFTGGELEHAILSCNEEMHPDIILVEGQAALRNPGGPCGSELLVSGNARHVILVHAPKRKYYDHQPQWGEIPPVESEIDLIHRYGSKVIALALNTEHCTVTEAEAFRREYEKRSGVPVILPLQEGCKRIVPLLRDIITATS
ncbi:MAG: DUF1611 domain-containing protein [Chitinophagaceae bacterium]|nr:DUF1611 domain-containing protein [Chitinophagaceae bacterium]